MYTSSPNSAAIYSMTAYMRKHIQSLRTSSVVHLERLRGLHAQCAKCQSAWEFFQFSAAIDAAPHLEPTKEPHCCFDKMLCSHCLLTDLLLHKQHGRDSNSTKLSIFFSVLCFSCFCMHVRVCVCATNSRACAGLQRGLVTAFLLPPMMKSLQMDCSNVSFLASDLLLDSSTF